MIVVRISDAATNMTARLAQELTEQVYFAIAVEKTEGQAGH